MKKLYVLVSLLFSFVFAFAQTQDTSLDRDRSKYAVNNFAQGDVYAPVANYDVVKVKQPKGKVVKNIIMMIGDGMGIEQASCGWVANKGKLNIDNCPYVGIQRTYAANKLITDSGASGSALASGQKTNYGYLGADVAGNPLRTAIDWAKARGMKTGVSVVCRINDATPSDYCCHTTQRGDEYGIAAQYVNSGVDFISGGGTHFWLNRPDKRDLMDEMVKKGYYVARNEKEMKAANRLPFLGLYSDYETSPALDRGDLCREAANKAIKLLDNKKGFFLMIEGSCIDDYCHQHKVGYAMEELFDFDRTVGDVLKWAEKDGQTLVIITADHSTGGLTLLDGNLKEGQIKVHFSTTGHNGIAVPVYAYGPHAEDFTGVYENAELGNKIYRLMQTTTAKSKQKVERKK